MGKIIAIANQKGGVGKTTTAINLSSALAHYDRKILLIDMDPQGNCSKGIGIDPALLKYTVFNALIQDVPFEKIIRKTEDKNIRLIPANLDLAASEARLLSLGLKSGFNYLKYALKDEKNNYDYILVDCPPSLGFLSLNALYASDSVLIPVQCEYFALEAIGQILGTINNIKRSSNPELEILGILLTMYDNRNKLSTEVTRQVLSFFKEKTRADFANDGSGSFTEGDKVGLYLQGDKGLSYRELTYSGGQWIPRLKRNEFGEGSISLSAHYPATGEQQNPETYQLNMALDQTEDGFYNSDLLFSKTVVGSGVYEADVNFGHVLHRIRIFLSGSVTSPEVKVRSLTQGNFNLLTGEVKVSGTDFKWITHSRMEKEILPL